MTARGRFIVLFRLLFLITAIGCVVWFVLARQPKEQASSASLVTETDADLSNAQTDLVFDGPVELIGPDGSVLSSKTGARLEPESGSFEVLGASRLSTHRE